MLERKNCEISSALGFTESGISRFCSRAKFSRFPTSSKSAIAAASSALCATSGVACFAPWSGEAAPVSTERASGFVIVHLRVFYKLCRYFSFLHLFVLRFQHLLSQIVQPFL